MTKPSWDKRIERARELAKTYPFAAESLSFYQEIARFQKGLYNYLTTSKYEPSENAGTTEESLDLFLLLPQFPILLGMVKNTAPSALASSAEELGHRGPNYWGTLLTDYWTSGASDSNGDSAPHIFFAHAFLQAHAEYLAERAEIPQRDNASATCPYCSRKPVVAVLRPEGHGGKRSLICSLCSTEWEYRRLLCASCGEEGVTQLPVYSASEFQHVRVDACDTCKTYMKTVDLTKDGLAVPAVDELATTPLNLWAEEHGYAKLELNLLGM